MRVRILFRPGYAKSASYAAGPASSGSFSSQVLKRLRPPLTTRLRMRHLRLGCGMRRWFHYSPQPDFSPKRKLILRIKPMMVAHDRYAFENDAHGGKLQHFPGMGIDDLVYAC